MTTNKTLSTYYLIFNKYLLNLQKVKSLDKFCDKGTQILVDWAIRDNTLWENEFYCITQHQEVLA